MNITYLILSFLFCNAIFSQHINWESYYKGSLITKNRIASLRVLSKNEGGVNYLTEEVSFTNSGKVSSIKVYQPNTIDSLISENYYTYNDDGLVKLINYTTLVVDGVDSLGNMTMKKLSYTHTFLYDSMRLKTILYDSVASYLSGSVKKQYHYDDKGYIKETIEYNKHKRSKNTITNYDGNGNKTESLYYNYEGELDYTESYTYNEHGKISSTYGQNHGLDKVVFHSIMNKYDDNNRLIQKDVYEYESSIPSQYYYTYSPNGLLSQFQINGDVFILEYLKRKYSSGSKK